VKYRGGRGKEGAGKGKKKVGGRLISRGENWWEKKADDGMNGSRERGAGDRGEKRGGKKARPYAVEKKKILRMPVDCTGGLETGWRETHTPPPGSGSPTLRGVIQGIPSPRDLRKQKDWAGGKQKKMNMVQWRWGQRKT